MFDKTERILNELENVIYEGEFSTYYQLEMDVRKIIMKVRSREINLINYKKSHIQGTNIL